MNDKWWASSTGTGDLALTVKGLLLALVPVTLTAAKYYNIELVEEQLVEIINAAVAVISALMIFIGLIRKAFNAR